MIDNTPPGWPDEPGHGPGNEMPPAPPPPPGWSQEDWQRQQQYQQDPQWQQPPPPPEFRPTGNSSFMRNMLRGLGIAATGCVAFGAGLFGACMAIFGGSDPQSVPMVLASLGVFLIAAVALFFLIRPRRPRP